MVWTPWGRPAAAAAPSTPSRATAALSSLAGAAASLTSWTQQPLFGHASDAALASQLQAQEDSLAEESFETWRSFTALTNEEAPAAGPHSKPF